MKGIIASLSPFKWIVIFLLTTIVWLVASSLYLYDIKHKDQHVDVHHLPPQYQNLAVDVRHSFLGLDPDQVVCYRESHRNFYVFTFVLLSLVVGLVALGLYYQRKHSFNLQKKNEEVDSQRKQLEHANEQIFSSIRYASLIQSSFLPKKEELNALFPSHCLLYEPKNLVSGDFYFCRRFGRKIVVVVGDCTGHGVPGAFLTVSNLSMLENLLPDCLDAPHTLLNRLQEKYDQSSQDPDIQVGLDVSVWIFDPDEAVLLYSGAHHSVFVQSEAGISEFKGGRRGIGPSDGNKSSGFELTKINVEGSEAVFLFSDGITDQFGGAQSKKAGKKRVLEWIEQTEKWDLSRKQVELNHLFQQWKGLETQTDDVCLLGFRFQAKAA